MRISVLLTIAGCVVAVLAIGAGLAALNLGADSAAGPDVSNLPPDDIQFAPEDGPQPVVDVDRPTHDFGMSTPQTEGSHTFVFRNTGQHELQLKEGPTDCRCMVSEADAAGDRPSGEKWTKRVPPGEAAEVTLKWETTESPGIFRKQATIWTSDRLHPRIELTIYGTVRPHIEVLPGAVNVSQMLADDSVTKQLQVLGTHFDHLSIVDHRLEKTASAEFIDVRYEPLPEDQLPSDYASGALVTVDIKPGLPFGATTQTIWLTTNVPEQTDIEIPVYLYVTPDITVAGEGYSSRTGALRLGVVASNTGVQRNLMMLVKGPQRTEIEIKSIVAQPDCLTAKLGEAKHLEAVTQIPLLVEIAPGAKPISRMGLEGGKSGEITIETNHPRMRQLRIPVKFAVEG